MRFTPGARVMRREVLHSAVWLEHPVAVVEDVESCFAVLLRPRSRFRFPEHPFGPHPWSHLTAWSGSQVLQLQRDGEGYSVWKFFTPTGGFTHWYINFQAPVTRHVNLNGGGVFDTVDHGIDLVIPGDGSGWYWKDVDDPAAMVRSGRISTREAADIAVWAAHVADLVVSDNPWWLSWADWVPAGAASSAG